MARTYGHVEGKSSSYKSPHSRKWRRRRQAKNRRTARRELRHEVTAVRNITTTTAQQNLERAAVAVPARPYNTDEPLHRSGEVWAPIPNARPGVCSHVVIDIPRKNKALGVVTRGVFKPRENSRQKYDTDELQCTCDESLGQETVQ